MSLKILFFIIPLLALNCAFGLVTSDKMPTKILKVYDKNVLVLNRGLEDGIFKGDHIKLTSEEGFIARGICLKASMLLSHWKIYRVVRPQLVSKDATYLLHSMNQSEIPDDLQSFRQVDLSEFFDFDDKITDQDLLKGLELQQERLAKYDLPESIIEAQSVPKNFKDDEAAEFIKKNISSKALKRDFKKLEFTAFASPVAWESLNNQRNLYFGFGVKNRGVKYDMQIQAEQRESRIVERYSKQEVEKLYRRAEGAFAIKDFAPKWSYVAYGLYEQEKQGDIYNPKSQINIGPAGFYRHFSQPNAKGEEAKFGFIPMFDKRVFENQQGEEAERSNARLGLHWYFREALSDKTTFTADFWHSPYFDLGTQELDLEDTRTNLKAVLNRKITDYFSFEYQIQYLKDITYKRDLGVEPENIINTVNFRIDANF